MKNIYKILIATICCITLLSGCDKDDESAFVGQDNAVTSFKLTLNEGGSLSASIIGDKIIINTIESRSLDGAQATITVSENAKIYPDPTTVSDWDNPQTFTVTSFNGAQQIYHYTVNKEKAEAIKKGNFTLRTQTEVDDFGTLGVEILDGDIILGVPYDMSGNYPKDAITSTASLSTLKEVKGTILIDASFDEENLSGFENLKEVGTISIPGNRNKLKSFIFPKLEIVHGNISMPGVLNAMSLRTVYLPMLTTVEGDFVIEGAPNLSSFIVPNLNSILGKLTLGGNGGMSSIHTLSFPKLELIGDIMKLYQFTNNEGKICKLEMPVLKKCGGFDWEQTYYIETIEFPMLEEINGSTMFGREWGNQSQTKKILLPNVVYIENLFLSAYNHLEAIEMPKLKEVKNVTLASMSNLKNLDLLSSLESIEGTLTLKNLSGLEEAFAIPSSLTTLNGLAVENIPGLTELDLRGTGIKDIGIASNASTPFILKADDVLEGSLTLSGLVELQGLKEIKGNVTITCTASDSENAQIPNTTKIGGDFTLNYSGKKGSVSISALQEVGGVFTIKSDAPFKADNLTTVGGSLLYDLTMTSLNGCIVSEFSLPKLKSVGGNFTVYTWARQTTVPLEIKMLSLTTIKGKLFIRHTDPNSGYGSSGLASQNLTNLDGFATLTSIGSVELWRHGSLKSYKGLKNAIRSISEDKWDVKNCAYNPSYDDMLKGNTEE